MREEKIYDEETKNKFNIFYNEDISPTIIIIHGGTIKPILLRFLAKRKQRYSMF
jgi:hypothetical protein